MWAKIRPMINCMIVGFEEFYKNKPDLKECTDKESALRLLHSFKKFCFCFSKVLKLRTASCPATRLTTASSWCTSAEPQ